jgi:hypothetical protein
VRKGEGEEGRGTEREGEMEKAYKGKRKGEGGRGKENGREGGEEREKLGGEKKKERGVEGRR